MVNLDLVALILQFVSCIFMAGVISVTQLIQYPCFSYIDREKFTQFHFLHSKAMSMIAAPLMILELVSALWLAKTGSFWFVSNTVAVFLLWGLTFAVSVPAHQVLATGFNEKNWKFLVKSNWVRTFLWVGRAIIFTSWFILEPNSILP